MNLTKKPDKNLYSKINSTIKHNEFFEEQTIKNKIDQLLLIYKYENYTQKTVKQKNHTDLFNSCCKD